MMVISEPTEGEPTKKRNGNSRTSKENDGIVIPQPTKKMDGNSKQKKEG